MPTDGQALLGQLIDSCNRELYYMLQKYYPALQHMDREDALAQTWGWVATHMQRLQTLPSDARFAYLWTTTRHYANAMTRQRGLRQRWELPLDETSQDSGSSVEDLVLRRQEMDILYHAIVQMPPLLREVFQLRFLCGLTNRQVAAQLGISPEQAATRTYRAKRWLQKQLREADDT